MAPGGLSGGSSVGRIGKHGGPHTLRHASITADNQGEHLGRPGDRAPGLGQRRLHHAREPALGAASAVTWRSTGKAQNGSIWRYVLPPGASERSDSAENSVGITTNRPGARESAGRSLAVAV